MSTLLNEVRNFELDEGFSPKEIKMAIGIASDPRYAKGNMTGAVTAMTCGCFDKPFFILSIAVTAPVMLPFAYLGSDAIPIAILISLGEKPSSSSKFLTSFNSVDILMFLSFHQICYRLGTPKLTRPISSCSLIFFLITIVSCSK
jgi:hypothetical protein